MLWSLGLGEFESKFTSKAEPCIRKSSLDKLDVFCSVAFITKPNCLAHVKNKVFLEESVFKSMLKSPAKSKNLHSYEGMYS